MRAVIFCRGQAVATAVSVVASIAGIELEAFPSLQELGSALYRDPDCIGVFWIGGWAGGVEVCREFRETGIRNALFVVLTSKSADGARLARERVMVLNAGADDAQHEPIDDREIVARLQALHRRERDRALPFVALPGGAIYTPDKSAIEGGVTVSLTGQENRLFDLLASRPGVLVSRAMCMLALYNERDEPQVKIVDVFICKLRKKLTAATDGINVIETVWGQGHRFRPEGVTAHVIPLDRRSA